MEMTKSEKLLEKNEIKNFADFFPYWVIQERAWFKDFPTLIFKKDGFYQQAQHENDKK